MITLIFIGIFGVIFGSFINALVWRLRKQDEFENDPKSTSHTKHSKHSHDKYSIVNGRSMCPNCGHALAARDLVPILSWISLRGRCRYCHKSISWQYPLVELITGLLFVASYALWPYEIVGFLGAMLFGVWLIMIVIFVALIIYDIRWQELPNQLTYILLALSFIWVAVITFQDGKTVAFQSVFAGAIIFGLFWTLHTVSKGAWIGGGDVKIAPTLGVLAGSPVKALMVIFIASLVGTLSALPSIVKDKKALKAHVPFGPALIIAACIVFMYGDKIISWYEKMLV